jgi:NAD(P)-dependent dehydrogenase (short-subunit alcohol dehydrogenase family)
MKKEMKMTRDQLFQDKVVIVTGAASGIGLATSQLFLKLGASVVLADLSEEKLSEAKLSLKNFNVDKILTFKCDVSEEADVIKTVAETLKHFGKLDVVVNNAGLMIFKSLIDHTTEDWMKVIKIDLMGAFYFIREAFKHMTNGGAIVNVSSIHAIETTPFVGSYAAAKAAILSLTRSAAIEGKEKGIRVNAVLPGAVDTPMLWENPNIKAGLEVIHQNEVGKAEDIASSIAYLASSEANFVQGSSLRVDGGRLANL